MLQYSSQENRYTPPPELLMGFTKGVMLLTSIISPSNLQRSFHPNWSTPIALKGVGTCFSTSIFYFAVVCIIFL
jgi:hypothetical protein